MKTKSLKVYLYLCTFFQFILIWQPGYTQTQRSHQVLSSARNGLPNFFRKLKNHEPVTIGYLGGSITEAAGYRVQTEKYFKETYPGSVITTINAGVGGTGSVLGAFRVGPELLRYHPDLVFIEFAVNDSETDSLMVCNAMEGIVRQIKTKNIKTDICFLYTVHKPMLNDIQQGRTVRSVRLMERIAEYYHIPSINLSYDVLNMLNKGDLVFQAEPLKDYGTRIIFSTDGTHPGTAGHAIYTKTIIAAFESFKEKGKMSKLPAPLFLGNFQKTAILQPDNFEKTSGWKIATDNKELQPYLKAYPGLIGSKDLKDSIIIKFKGTYLGIGDILGPSAAAAAVLSVDNENPVIKPRFDSYCWFYRRSFYLLGPLQDTVHTVTIKKADMSIDKSRLINGHASEYGSSSFESANIYIGNILLIGEPL